MKTFKEYYTEEEEKKILLDQLEELLETAYENPDTFDAVMGDKEIENIFSNSDNIDLTGIDNRLKSTIDNFPRTKGKESLTDLQIFKGLNGLDKINFLMFAVRNYSIDQIKSLITKIKQDIENTEQEKQ
jgi:hypothetical protein